MLTNLLRTLIWMVGVLGLLAVVLYQQGWLSGPLTPAQKEVQERVRIHEALVNCAALGGADNSDVPQARLAHAVTIYNIAMETAVRAKNEIIADTCAVFNTFGELMVPGESTEAWRREWNVRMFSVSQEAFDVTARAFRRYLEDPKPLLLEQPWLTQSVRSIRTRWKRWAPYQNEAGMRTKMCRLYGTPPGDEFFRYKKSPDEVCS